MRHPWQRARGALVLWAFAFLAFTSACSGDGTPTVPPPAEVETCDELVEVASQLVVVWADVLEQLPLDQLLADEMPPEFAELAAIGADLDARASRLGCDAEQMNVDVRALIARGDLSSTDSAVVELLLDIIQAGVVGELEPPPNTTTTTSSG